MNQIKQHYDNLILEINQAFDNELDSLDILFPALKEKTIQNIRFGLFSKKDKQKVQGQQQTLPGVGADKSDSERQFHDRLYGEVQINFEQLARLDRQLIAMFGTNQASMIFNPSMLEHIQGKFVEIYFEHDDYDTFVHVHPCLNDVQTYGVDSLFANWTVFPTLPPYDEVFDGPLEDSHDWRAEYIDLYEEWAWKTYLDYSVSRAYIQIGGWGNFIQGNYENYVAQVNNEIGDCGAQFIYLENGEFKGHLDMC